MSRSRVSFGGSCRSVGYPSTIPGLAGFIVTEATPVACHEVGQNLEEIRLDERQWSQPTLKKPGYQQTRTKNPTATPGRMKPRNPLLHPEAQSGTGTTGGTSSSRRTAAREQPESSASWRVGYNTERVHALNQ